MRHLASAVLGIALLGALTACAERPTQVGFGGQPQQEQPAVAEHLADPQQASGHPVSQGGVGGTVRGWPAPPAGARELPAGQIEASALPEGYPRLVWTEGEDRVLGLYGQEGGCTKVHPEVREQGPRAVRVALVEVTYSLGPCTMDLRFPPLSAALDAPLGGRTVILERQTIEPRGR